MRAHEFDFGECVDVISQIMEDLICRGDHQRGSRGGAGLSGRPARSRREMLEFRDRARRERSGHGGQESDMAQVRRTWPCPRARRRRSGGLNLEDVTGDDEARRSKLIANGKNRGGPGGFGSSGRSTGDQRTHRCLLIPIGPKKRFRADRRALRTAKRSRLCFRPGIREKETIGRLMRGRCSAEYSVAAWRPDCGGT